ncbi:MAG: hypothetical protein ABL892_05370 [Thiobacillaceae bacterium]
MTTLRRFIVLLAITLAFSANVMGEVLIQLGEEDFTVAGISIGTDSASVQRTLGKPKDVTNYAYTNDPSGKYSVWKYAGLLVHVGVDKTVFGITIQTTKFPTKRGLKVGDSIGKLVKLYGKPSGTYQPDWDYELPGNDLEVMRVNVHNHKITSIYAGTLSD